MRSLQQRLYVFMLLPVAVLLLAMGYMGLVSARNHLLTQWGESAILRLQQAAHHIDMRLSRPKDMLKLFNKTAGIPHAHHVQKIILDQLRELEGVVRADLIWTAKENGPAVISDHDDSDHASMHKTLEEGTHIMPFHRGGIVDVTPPRYDSPASDKTISLISDLKDENDKIMGGVEVVLRFDYLVDIVEATGWWQKHKAFLVGDAGRILTSNIPKGRKVFAENNDPLEKSTLYSMVSMPFGTLFGQGFPPDEVSSFYKLQEAPWTLVIITPGREVLSPILHFQLYYYITGAVFILVILLLIRFVTGHTVRSIKEVSRAAEKIAAGQYDITLTPKTHDEVGELIQSFNTMVFQLEERARLKDSLSLAKEVQQNLLPQKKADFEFLDVAGTSIYCDETGGDYYDFIQSSELGRGQTGVAVGDVAGHGIASALLMTTVRALLRSRIMQPGRLSKMITDVNGLLCRDTEETGSFMTLFFMVFDPVEKKIRWVRAGHDPAIFYDPSMDEFDEFGGRGIALGVDDQWSFQEYERNGWSYGQVVLIGTDGIWETENPQGEMFGKDRLRQVIRRHSHGSAEKILRAIIDELTAFRQNITQKDDITLVIVKAKP